MSTKTSTAVDNRLRLYSEEAEHWKKDHTRAMECLDFELLLQNGIAVYEAINHIDENWRSKVLSGESDHDQEAEDKIVELYQWWIQPCDVLLSVLEGFEREFEVKYAIQFRRACEEVSGLLTPDDEFFSGGDLVVLRDEAIDAHQRGECESLEA